MWIFDFSDYKRFLNAHIASLPKKGRGQSLALANVLNVQQSVVSAILNQDRHLTLEQALTAAAFFGFDEVTTDALLLLVNRQRADTKALREYWAEKFDSLREKEMNLAKFSHEDDRELSEADKAIYYSNWYYSAARIAVGRREYRTVDALAKFLNLSREKTAKILDFFLKTKIVKNENGVLVPTSIGTSINDSSEILNNHRRNWRDKGRESMAHPNPADWYLTIPMAMGEKDAEWFRGEMRILIKSLIERLQDSPEEVNRCLNIDWFEF